MKRWFLDVIVQEPFFEVMAENGAQELEVFDTFEHKAGYAYMPVMRQ